MVDKATATVNTDSACEGAHKDADAIRDAFSHKGIEEAYELLKQDRKNVANLSPAEQDTYEKEMVNALSANGGKTDILPGLSLAYLKEHEVGYKNPDDGSEFDVREVGNDAKRLFDKREMEDSYAGLSGGKTLNKVDDIEVTLLGNAADLLKKNDFNGKNIKGLDDLDDVLKDNKENVLQEDGFQKTRDFNKSIAEAFVKNSRLFANLDEANGDEERDGKITQKEVQHFLDHCDKNPSYKALFTDEEMKAVQDLKKTFDDPNNHEDDNQVFVKHWNPLIGSRKNWITEDSIKEAVGGEAGIKAIEKTVAEEKAKATEKKDEKTDSKEENKKDGDKTTVEDAAKKKAENTNEKTAEKTKTEVVDAETQMLNDAVQKVGEGPYQVAARLLRNKHDSAAQTILTQILREQLIEDTGSKTYAEAVSKLDVGHKFMTCEGLEKIREKAEASKNPTLKELFGKSQAQLKAEADAEKKAKTNEEKLKELLNKDE